MSSCRVRWTAGWLAGLVLVFSGQGLLHAGLAQSEQTLSSQGLKPAGNLYILGAESEFHQKLDEARQAGKRLNYAVMQQRGSLSEKEYKDTINQLSSQVGQLRSQLNAVNQQIRAMPRNYGRFSRRGFANNYVAEQNAELQMYRNQLQAELNQGTALLGQLKSQPFDPKAKQKIDSEVQDHREAYQTALKELRQLADATKQKYAELDKNAEVKKALETMGRTATTKPKLGPSQGFLNNVKLLERLEKASSDGETADGQARPASKNRRGAKGKRSSRSAAAPGGSGSPF